MIRIRCVAEGTLKSGTVKKSSQYLTPRSHIEAIVNAANTSLLGGGGVDGAIPHCISMSELQMLGNGTNNLRLS